MLQQGNLGVHPPGALGVAFFVHASANCLLGRGGNGVTSALKEKEMLRLQDNGKQRIVSLKNHNYSNLLEADALDAMPELILVCCNPDQLESFTAHLVWYLENLADRGKLTCIKDIQTRVPILLILPNGVLFEQTIKTYENQLHEAILLHRLQGVSENMLPAFLDRVVRGVALQAGGRRGSGTEAVYLLERKGSLVFADGGDQERSRIETILSAHDYPFKHVCGVPGTRIEFDKGMISMILNVGGLIHMVDSQGKLLDLRMGDLCKDPTKADFVTKITQAVFDVGKAVGAYPKDASYGDVWPNHLQTILAHAGHITSSLKGFRDALTQGLDSVQLFSNEEWLLTPLSYYAAKVGLTKEEELFNSLRCQVQAAMARAIRYREQDSEANQSGANAMNLTAQRNINIELYDSDPDNLLLIGTMLDQEHLIKLQVTIYLPDEQITRSKIQMIRSPFPVCREVHTLAERLVGLRIQRGVLSEISERLGGSIGCSHIKELANSLVYFVASHLVRRRAGIDPMSTDYARKPAQERFTVTKELLRDSCLAYCQTTPQMLDEQFGIKRIGKVHQSPIQLEAYEPSLGKIVQDRCQRWAKQTYIRSRVGEVEHEISREEFGKNVFQIARHLIDQGIQPGHRIAMLSENRVEMFMFELAAISIGATSIPIFAGYPKAQVAYVIGHARPRFVVVSGVHQLEKIDKKQHGWIEKYYCMDFNDEAKAWGAIDFSSWLKDGGATSQELDKRIDAVSPDDLCIVMYTSGTTGPPKGVKLSHRNIISQQKAIEQIWDVGENDAVLSYLPWHHSFGGLFERFMTLYHGCTLCLDDSRGRDIERLIDNWSAFNPTLFFSVPRIHDMLITKCRERPEINDLVFGKRLRFVFTAGASLSAPVAAAYRKHDIPVLEGWGLTETSPCVTMTSIDGEWKSGSVGTPIPGVRVRVDGDQEILVKGPNVMSGYLDDEEATSRVIDKNGWLHTGDLGKYTNDGLTLYGRKDGAFKLTTGEKVHPQRIETVLVNESPLINLAVALGSGKDYVSVLIYPDFSRLRAWAQEHDIQDDNLVNLPAVRALYAAELSRINPMIEVKYQRIRRAVLAASEPSLETGELTATGKIARRSVINNHKRDLEELFSLEPNGSVIEVGELQRTH